MRKFFVAAALLIISMAAIYLTACNDNKTEAQAAENKDSVAKVMRGEYLANRVAICMDCHSKRDVTKWSLPIVPGSEGGGAGFPFGKAEMVPGEVTPPNITPFALKDWSDDDIARAMTQGINKKGDTLFPMMPYHNYSQMAKDDIYSIIAYLRTLKPIEGTVPPRHFDVPLGMMGISPLPPADFSKNVRPDPSDKVKYGQYLVTFASCGECHTPRTQQGAPIMDRAFSGGFVFATPFFKVAVGNITPDSATGIGALSEEAFLQKFKANSSDDKVNVNPGKENSIMPWAMYGKMKDEDLKAIYAYLRTVKPIINKVEKFPK